MYYAHTNENNVLIQTQTQAKVGKSDFSLVCLVRKLTLVMFRDSDKPKLLFCAIKLFNSEKCSTQCIDNSKPIISFMLQLQLCPIFELQHDQTKIVFTRFFVIFEYNKKTFYLGKMLVPIRVHLLMFIIYLVQQF